MMRYALVTIELVLRSPSPFITTQSESWYSFTIPRRVEGWVDLTGWLRPRWFTCPQTVTHPSTNRAGRRVTLLIRHNALPLRHGTNRALSVSTGVRLRRVGSRCINCSKTSTAAEHTLASWRRRSSLAYWRCSRSASTRRTCGYWAASLPTRAAATSTTRRSCSASTSCSSTTPSTDSRTTTVRPHAQRLQPRAFS